MTIVQIQCMTALQFGISVSELIGRSRTKQTATARLVAYLLCRRHTSASYPDIGRAFAKRDHTSIMAGIRSVSRTALRDSHLARSILQLELELLGSRRFDAERVVEGLEMCA